MTKEELKNKCTERAKIFQQAMESCKSSNPINCIEWFADRITDLERENKLLGERCNQLLKDKGNLTDELAKWKDEWQEQVQKAIDEGYARTLQTMQLTKAKKLLKQFLEAKNSEDTYKAEWEAEQLLKEIEK